MLAFSRRLSVLYGLSIALGLSVALPASGIAKKSLPNGAASGVAEICESIIRETVQNPDRIDEFIELGFPRIEMLMAIASAEDEVPGETAITIGQIYAAVSGSIARQPQDKTLYVAVARACKNVIKKRVYSLPDGYPFNTSGR